ELSCGATESDSSKFVDAVVDGTTYKVHYNELGSGEETVIMLHGSGPGATSWANFNKNIGPFVNENYRVILMDCPGWGKSDPVVCTGSRSDFNAECLKDLMDGLDIEKAHLIGNSMGGHSVVAFALHNPDRIGKLVLMGGGTGGPSQFVAMPTEGIKLLQGLYRDPSIESLKKMMSVFVFDSSNLTEELFQTRLENMLSTREHLKNFVKSIDANPKQFPDFGTRLGEISAETLVIWGRDDRFVPMDIGLRLIRGIPNAQLHIFNKCGHWAQYEHADRFNRMVLEFLKH
ncbi:MAG: alpha/beta fold hydrolase, partial [Neptuniibacter sp.]